MRHTLRKYLSNRGSALFMVLSTMTALLISCTAMYFSVVSSRSTQYAIFYQQQSYQSATSLADAVMASIVSGSGGFEDIGKKLFAESFKVGDKITTGSNGYKAFAADGSGNEEDDQVGAYMLEAVRLPDETRADGKTQRMFDIIITTSVNGKKEVYHNIFSAQELTQNIISGPSRVFAATGYAPNDVYLDGGVFTSDVYYDNELTVLNAYGGKGMILTGNLTCGGSLTINKYLNLVPQGKTEMLIRNTFTSYSNTPLTFKEPTGVTEEAKNKSRSNVLIGGDCYLIDGASFKNANVYVLGDLIVRGNSFDTSCRYFVDGDIILEKGTYGGYWHNLSTAYCNGTVDTSKNTGGGLNGALAGKWTGTAKGKTVDGLMTVEEMIEYLDYETSSTPQYNWNVKTDGLKEEIIEFDSNPASPKPTVELKYSDSYKGCIIKDVVMNNDTSSYPPYNNFTLVIDTGEDPENIFTIGLTANRAIAGDSSGAKTMFCWFPRNKANGTTSKTENMNMKFQILVKGRGSVVMSVPDGVIYQDDHEMVFQHYGWFVMNGGKEQTVGGVKIYENTPNSGQDMNFFSKFIHTSCYEGDGCHYEEFDTLEDCPYECGGKLKEVRCADHGVVDQYCPACEPLRADHIGKCANRKDLKKIDAFLNANPAMKDRMKDSTGKVIYPNTNIFLVSCSENVDIRFSQKANADPKTNPEPIRENSFFGFIYAPYLTYKSENGAGNGDSGGGYVRILGGMTVSDYVIDASYGILSCFPDKMPEDLMDEDSKNNPLGSIANKSWKINLRAH